MFGQLSLEGLSDFEPTKKSNNKEAKQQKPAAQGQTKSDEKKAAAKKATKPEVSPLAEDTVIAKGILYCQPLAINFEKKSVKELQEMLRERSFLEADYFEFFSLAEDVVLAALPYSSTVPLTEDVSPEDRLVRFGDSVSVPEDDGSYSMKDLLALFVEAYPHYNDSAQKTLAVRENVRGMNAPITNNATIIPTGFSSGIVGNSTSLVSK